MKLMVPNGERHHVFYLLSSSKMAFLLHSFLFVEIQVTDVKNLDAKVVRYIISPPKMLVTLHKPWDYIFGVLQHIFYKAGPILLGK